MYIHTQLIAKSPSLQQNPYRRNYIQSYIHPSYKFAFDRENRLLARSKLFTETFAGANIIIEHTETHTAESNHPREIEKPS